MQLERETKTITLPRTGVSVVLNGFITGAERRAIERVYLDAMQLKSTVNGGKREMEMGGVSGSVSHEMQDATFRAVIVSVAPKGGDAITDKVKIVEALLQLPESDYTQVVRAVNEVTDPKEE